MNPCSDFSRQLDAYVDGELTLAERVAFEEALSNCPQLREQLDQLLEIRRLLGELPVETTSPDFMYRLRLRRVELRGKLQREASTTPAWKILFAATLATFVLGVAYLNWPGRVETPGNSFIAYQDPDSTAKDTLRPVGEYPRMLQPIPVSSGGR